MIPRARDSPKFEDGPSPLYLSMLRDSNTKVESQPAGIQAASKSPGWTADSRTSLYPTAAGVLNLVLAGRISLPTKEIITERSKSDLLAKTLVCLQAGYIIVQCISRLASGLPLTFLEINTSGHVLCALVMYSFWFRKPVELSLSIALASDLAKQLLTWHRCSHQFAAGTASMGRPIQIHRLTVLCEVDWERAKSADYFELFGSQSPSPTSLQSILLLAKQPTPFDGYHTELAVVSLTGNECLLVVRVWGYDTNVEDTTISGGSMKIWNLLTGIYVIRSTDRPPKYIKESSRVRLCLVLDDFWNVDRAIQHLLDTRTEPINYRHDHVEEEIRNWPFQGLLSGHTYLPAVVIAISTALYGGLHAAVWHFFFPSFIEKWLWRVSSTLIAGSGMCSALGVTARVLYWWRPSLTYARSLSRYTRPRTGHSEYHISEFRDRKCRDKAAIVVAYAALTWLQWAGGRVSASN